MKVIASSGRDDLAKVYIVEFDNGLQVECAESLQPPHTINQKWVMLISTLFGCPVGCSMCDAGEHYNGRLSAKQMEDQILMMVRRRYPTLKIPSSQFKVQFARMGEPALNTDVLQVLEELPNKIIAPGFMPSISTVAPNGTDGFFEKLLSIKNKKYTNGHFQLQFSLHTTDSVYRKTIIPINTWGMSKIARYGERFYSLGDRKVTLNFALAQGSPLEAKTLLKYFDSKIFLIKITPLNPTYKAKKNKLQSHIDPSHPGKNNGIIESLKNSGYDVILSIGDQEENHIGSNCGQYLEAHKISQKEMKEGYTYPLNKHS